MIQVKANLQVSLSGRTTLATSRDVQHEPDAQREQLSANAGVLTGVRETHSETQHSAQQGTRSSEERRGLGLDAHSPQTYSDHRDPALLLSCSHTEERQPRDTLRLEGSTSDTRNHRANEEKPRKRQELKRGLRGSLFGPLLGFSVSIRTGSRARVKVRYIYSFSFEHFCPTTPLPAHPVISPQEAAEVLSRAARGGFPQVAAF
ncbi:hypothetical protein DPEC_G00335220 [Dallia pectoralis]|uniref:Uncharacterized protein n=1 Tax=Dallia pectoralis TaxID=75939 RepID=A0ACC2F6T8_DALPE|nr:hypothetical protein DPEC_G00335220 [Dallia pectoralis]